MKLLSVVAFTALFLNLECCFRQGYDTTVVQAFTLSRRLLSFTTITTSTTTTTTSVLLASVNNVVLRPTTTAPSSETTAVTSSDDDEESTEAAVSSTKLAIEDIFDSFQIGSPIVHRYKSESAFDLQETGSDVNYVMWYQGRSIAQDREENQLPPLSTGRIGRATSMNGLAFQKDVKGAEGEDIKGVSLGLNNESWWGFDTAHVGLGSVLLPMTTPAVMTEGGIFLMYYFGGNFEETAITNYMSNVVTDDSTSSTSFEDYKLKGMNMRIGVAVSQDGKTWGRVEGDDPTGACMVPYDKNDPDTNRNNEKDDDGKTDLDLTEELYCAWPEVVVKIISESDTKQTGEQSGFFMYYSTMTKDTKEKCVAVAVSSDGFRWLKRGLCLGPSPNSLDDGGVARCNVVRNASYDKNTQTWYDEPGYIMYYEGVSTQDQKHRILSATSSDGRSWTKTNDNGPVLDIGDNDEETWDCDGVGSPHILRMDDGSQRMYYVGQQQKKTAVGVAKLEYGSNKWVKEQSSIVFAVAEA
eukprot:CAMPEP_0170954814 /NCGR_PEP_ID=MMETSP0735-20130129/32777_1 /TAXON_ID=186038 /ORGANISM="Fragilariopsis kerguelensis, Strain L26-C5" /LENGTH=523 /DNA_ID=CAMNT_0011366505 /DNA_START=66 /DNA_END=1637 /DNA_ORIENTATION=-